MCCVEVFIVHSLQCWLKCACLWYVLIVVSLYFFFFFKQKTAYEMRISDWSSDVCSSDLMRDIGLRLPPHHRQEDAPGQRAGDEQRAGGQQLGGNIADRAIAQPGDKRRDKRQEDECLDHWAVSPSSC